LHHKRLCDRRYSDRFKYLKTSSIKKIKA